MTIQTPTYRVVKIMHPKRPFTNKWTDSEGGLPPIRQNDTVKGRQVC